MRLVAIALSHAAPSCTPNPFFHYIFFAHFSFARFVVFQLFYMFIIRCSLMSWFTHRRDLLFHRMKTKLQQKQKITFFSFLIDLVSVAVRPSNSQMHHRHNSNNRMFISAEVRTSNMGQVNSISILASRIHHVIKFIFSISRDHRGPQAMVGLARVLHIIHFQFERRIFDSRPLTADSIHLSLTFMHAINHLDKSHLRSADKSNFPWMRARVRRCFVFTIISSSFISTALRCVHSLCAD